MRFRNLGPLEAWDDELELELGSGRQRVLLALLLLHANELVSTDRLIEDLWSGQAPPSASKVLQGYVSHLRRALGPDAIVTRGSGYLLQAADTDAADFEKLLDDARSQRPHDAARTLRAALDLWRGGAFADVEYEGWAQGEIGRLEELRLVALEERIDADIALGRHADVVAELESLVAAHLLRERLRGLLMLALYRCDRQGEALEAYRAARSTLVEELGIEPSKALQRLEQAILTQDPELDAKVGPVGAARPIEREPAPTGTVTFLSIDVEGSTRLVHELRGGYGDVLAGFRRVVRDAVAEVSGYEVDTQGDAFLLAFGSAHDAVAVALAIQRALGREPLSHGTRVHAGMGVHSGEPGVGPEGYHGIDVVRVSRICAAGHGDQILLSNAAKELVEGELPAAAELRELGSFMLKDLQRPERIYQLDADGAQREFPPLLHAVSNEHPTGLRRLVRPQSRRRDASFLAAGLLLLTGAIGAGVYRIASGGSAPAVLALPNSVVAIDQKTDRVSADIPVGNTPTAVAVGEGSVWVLNSNEQTVSRIDPSTKTLLRTIPAATTASDIAVGTGAVWVAGAGHILGRIDPDVPLTPRLVTLPGVQNPLLLRVESQVAATSQAVWATTTGAVWRIEPAPRRRFDVIEQGCCGAIAIGFDSIWVAGSFGVERLRAGSGEPEAQIKLPFRGASLAVGVGGVWVSDSSSDRIWRIDPKLNTVGTTIAVGQQPTGIAVGAGSVWVASGNGTVSRIDPTTDRVVITIDVGGTPSGIAVGAGTVWVSID